MEQKPKPAEAPKPKGRKMWVIVAAVVVIIIVVVAGLYFAGYFGGGGTQVSIVDEGTGTACQTSGDAACKFDPTPLNIKTGTKVFWKNTGGVAHTATSSTGAPASFDYTLDPGKSSAQFTFTATGTYNYTCTIHSWMKGQVIVTS